MLLAERLAAIRSKQLSHNRRKQGPTQATGSAAPDAATAVTEMLSLPPQGLKVQLVFGDLHLEDIRHWRVSMFSHATSCSSSATKSSSSVGIAELQAEGFECVFPVFGVPYEQLAHKLQQYQHKHHQQQEGMLAESGAAAEELAFLRHKVRLDLTARHSAIQPSSHPAMCNVVCSASCRLLALLLFSCIFLQSLQGYWFMTV